MPTTEPRKSVNLGIEDHENAKVIADLLTKRIRRMTGNPNIKATAIREANSYALLKTRESLEEAEKDRQSAEQ